MKTALSHEELMEIARQLSNPDGDHGVEVGERMNLSNGNMIKRGIESLGIQKGDAVLEIGPGNGSHVSSILDLAGEITYHGVDISETMVLEAQKKNAHWGNTGRVTFTLSDGHSLDFQDNFFDSIFTVNTVYFWENPIAYAKEIFRVLKPNGVFNLVFADKDFMAKLPFTEFGFQLYDKNSAETLLKDAGFSIHQTIEEVEATQSNLGVLVNRPIIMILARKSGQAGS